MPLRCPECATGGWLTITRQMELPPDSRSDEITLQIIKCTRCGFAGLAVYEESRRGALDSESISHLGYRVDAEELKAIDEVMSRCPQPKNSRCRCSAHRKLARKNALGRWDGLSSVRLQGGFNIEL